MKFPFFISQTIKIKQAEHKITSEIYILGQIKERLLELDMKVTKVSDYELFFEKVDFMRLFRKKDFLRNLSVKVKSDNSVISVILKTETIFIFTFGCLPYFLLFVPKIEINITFAILLSLFFWGIGFLIKYLILNDIKNIVEIFLKEMRNF